MRYVLPGDLRHDVDGYRDIVRLWQQTERLTFEEIEIDLSAVSWLAADMCAPLGAILYRLGENLNSIRLSSLQPQVEEILRRNGFLSTYGRAGLPDSWGTTIPYQRFDRKDDRFFVKYVEDELVQRSEMPQMSTALLKKFQESIYEVFNNAVVHSGTEYGIFACGQYFRKKDLLVFAVADLGIGIRRNIEQARALVMDAVSAIKWATAGHNTTKRGRIPGGLGLKLLKEFIQLNQGCFQIVSDSGYWSLQQGRETAHSLPYPFPGTVVSIAINTADLHSYRLQSELTADDIF